MPLIFAVKTMGSEQQLQRNSSNQGYSGKKRRINKKPFAEPNSEFVSEHDKAEKSPPQLRTARKINELEEKVKRGWKAFQDFTCPYSVNIQEGELPKCFHAGLPCRSRN